MAYLFEHRSEVILNAGPDDEERLLESLLGLDADGYELFDKAVMVHGPFEALELSLIHISSPRDLSTSRMPSSA